jgi:hypothetical protein
VHDLKNYSAKMRAQKKAVIDARVAEAELTQQ